MESSTVQPGGAERTTVADTIAAALRNTAEKHPDVVAVRTVDDSVAWTWSQLLARVDSIAAGLEALGVQPGENVALMLTNRPEFNAVDLAVATLRAVPFSIYQTYPADSVQWLVNDAAARVIVTEQAYLAVVLAAARDLPAVEHIVVVDTEAADAPAGTVALATVEAGGSADFDGAAAAAAVRPTDLATLIYTSGTTGPPKGVELSNAAIMSAASIVSAVLEFPPGSRVISWLPAAHIAERMAHHYIPTVYAGTVTVCPNPREIAGFLPQVRPNWFFAVPRVWEKIKLGLEAMLAGQDATARAPMEQALAAALERVRLRQAGAEVPAELEAAVAKADAKIFTHLRTMLGLDQLRAVNVGAAPTAVEVLEFFHAIGIEIGELWGMSESCGAGTTNRPGEARIGTVGPPSPGVEVRLGDDGELLIRGPVLMDGYRNAPEKTAEALDADGWLHTGDIATIDADGFVRIVDRKKELIINAAGKNMSPANIEAALKAGGPMIGQVCVIGDARPYNTALIVLDPDYAPVWAAQNGLEGEPMSQLVGEPAVIAAVQAAVDNANERLARVEQIKRFTVLADEWLPGGEELTPTMKLKRKPISARYAEQIEAMYS